MPSEPRRIAAAASAPPSCASPVAGCAAPREVARERERERDGRVEVRAGDVADGVDLEHDHEPERDRDADVPELMRLVVDHDRAAPGEDEREGADRLGDERSRQRRHLTAARLRGSRGDRYVLRDRAGVLTALTIAPCIPSATWWVNVTSTSSKPAASRPASYSPFRQRARDAADVACRARARSSGASRSSATTSDDADPAARLENARDLGEHRRLVGREVDHAVRDHDVDRLGRQRERPR